MYSSLAYYVSPVSMTHMGLSFLMLKKYLCIFVFSSILIDKTITVNVLPYNPYLVLWVELAQNGLQHKIIHGSLCTRQNKEM